MKKLKKSEDEKKFILSASEADLMDYVLCYPFRPRNEIYLVERGDPGPLRTYIELYGLKAAAAVSLFRFGDYEATQTLLDAFPSAEIIKLFLNEGSYQHVKRYVDRHPDVAKYLPEYIELKYMENHHKDLINLIKKETISPFAKLDILVRGDEELKKAVICLGGMQPREREYLLYLGTEKELQLWEREEMEDKIRDTIYQVKLLRFCPKPLVLSYLEKHRLRRTAEEFMFYMVRKDAETYFDIAIYYIRRYRPEGGDTILFTYTPKEKLIQYLYQHRLTDEGEGILINRNNDEELVAYFRRHHLNDEHEAEFVRRTHKELLLSYIKKYSLNDLAQMALVERGDAEEIAAYMQLHPVADAVEEELKVRELWTKVQELLVA